MTTSRPPGKTHCPIPGCLEPESLPTTQGWHTHCPRTSVHPSWHIDFRRDPPLVAKERYKKAFKDEFGWWIFANSSAPRVKRENAPQTQADWDKITPAVKETLQYQIRALLREEVEAYFARRAVETGSGEHPSANMRAAVLTKLDEVSTLLRAVNGRER